MILLSVNVNKIAVLRNSRGGTEPDVVFAADTCMRAGCGGITVHPRPDSRHIRPDDVIALAKLTADRVEFNIEGNPFAPARGHYPGLLALVEQSQPTQVTLVPDGDAQLTSDHGFDLAKDAARLAPLISALKQHCQRVSLFINAGANDLSAARAIDADRIEIYTGPYAEAARANSPAMALNDCIITASAAQRVGLGVNAGHDLNQVNLGKFLRDVPHVKEVSIGHALIGEALYEGLDLTVRRYLQVIADAI